MVRPYRPRIIYNNFSLFYPLSMCCGPNSYTAVHGVFAIIGLLALLPSRLHGWSRFFLELTLHLWAGQLEEAQRPEVQPGEGHLGEEERGKGQHMEAGLVEGQHREVQTGKGQRGEAEPGVDQLGEAVQVLRSELDRRARCCPDRC